MDVGVPHQGEAMGLGGNILQFLNSVWYTYGEATALKGEYNAIFMDVFDALVIIKVNGG